MSRLRISRRNRSILRGGGEVSNELKWWEASELDEAVKAAASVYADQNCYGDPIAVAEDAFITGAEFVKKEIKDKLEKEKIMSTYQGSC